MNQPDINATILLVGHGSRHAEGNREIETFARQWRERNPQWHIEVCFIEFADVLLDHGLDNAAAHAAGHSRRVIVVPLILNAAGHVKMEVPHAMAQARRRHPSVEFIYARHLGACEEVCTILKRGLHNCMAALDMPDPKTTGVILLGRGSSDRVANGELAKMSRWLFEDSDHELVDMAFTGIAYPRLESVVQRQQRLGMTQVVVLPYYLFTGTLIERIKRQVQRLQHQYSGLSLTLGDYFGFEPEVFRLLNERVLQAAGVGEQQAQVMLECDGCKYRELAQEQGHGHQHDHDHHHHHEHETLIVAKAGAEEPEVVA